MSANRVPHPLPLLDDATAEHLLLGGPIDELPDEHQRLGQLLMATRAPALPHELEGSAAAAASFIAAHEATRPAARRRPRSLAAMAVIGVLMAASTGSAVAATHGSLPEPVQQVAHEALGVVGISVPGIEPSRDLHDSADPAVSSQPTVAGSASESGTDQPIAPLSAADASHVVNVAGSSAATSSARGTGSSTTIDDDETVADPVDATIPDNEDPKIEDPVSEDPAPAEPPAGGPATPPADDKPPSKTPPPKGAPAKKAPPTPPAPK